MENILNNNEINYEGLLPEILKEEKVGYKGLLAGGIFSATLAAINPLAFIPGAAFVASYLYKNKFSKVTKSKQYFNGARDIYLNSVDNKVALSIALFYANKAIEYDITNFKAIAMKAFILKAMGNISEMTVVLNTIPDDRVEFNEVRDILTALQLKSPSKVNEISQEVYLTEEEIKEILKEKGFNISKEFLDSIHKSIEHLEEEKERKKVYEKESLTYESKENVNEDISNEDIEDNIEGNIHREVAKAIEAKEENNEKDIENIEVQTKEVDMELLEKVEEDKSVEGNLVSVEEVEKIEEDKESVVFNHIKNLFHQNKISCSLSMNKTSRYCDIMGENRFIRFKLNGKKEYAITPFTVKELKDTNISLHVEVTPKSETGVSRVIFNSLDDLEYMNEVIIKCYNKSLT